MASGRENFIFHLNNILPIIFRTGWGPGYDGLSLGNAMDFLGATTPCPFQKLAFCPHWLTTIENELRRNFERQQHELRFLRDENIERQRRAPRAPSTTRAIAASDAPTTPVPVAVVGPRVEEMEWEEAAQPGEEVVLLM